MKTVASGENYTTVTVDTAEVVKFSFASTSLSVKVIEGEITVALTETAQAEDDGTITVSEGETEMFNHYRMNVDTYYLTGSGKAVLHASNMSDANPFEGKGKGGDAGGDNTHYKGTTTTPLENGSTTNPITIVKDEESYTYTAVFGDVVVYGYTEFVFDGTQWSEFGRPFDTTPTSGSTNAVTSDGIYAVTPSKRGTGAHSVVSETGNSTATKELSIAFGYECQATGARAFAQGQIAKAIADYSSAIGYNTTASGLFAHALNYYTLASQPYMTAIGAFNKPRTGDLFNIGNGSGDSRSNIVEVNRTSLNVNGDIKINNVAIPTSYATMPTITASMLGKIAMYVGATGNGYTQGCFYIASTDGATEPTYSWVQIGGSYREVELYFNDEHAATPVDTVLTLSQDWAGFDAIGFVSEYNGETGLCTYNECKVSVISAISRIVLNFNIGANANSAIFLSKNTSNSFVVSSISAPSAGLSHVYKIIGIKY